MVRYIYNAANPAKDGDLVRLPWQEVATKIVEHGMQGFCSACQEKDWFFELDLEPAFVAAVSTILKAMCPRLSMGVACSDACLQDSCAKRSAREQLAVAVSFPQLSAPRMSMLSLFQAGGGKKVQDSKVQDFVAQDLYTQPLRACFQLG